ncbi:ATP synthase subunit b [Bienertia sinuspersici]
MGKNQAYKAMQRSRVGTGNAAPEEIEDGMVDGSFHTPEWHAARLASLSTTHTVTWEEFKMKQKERYMPKRGSAITLGMGWEDALKRGEVEADKDRMMREYRAQLDAERERKLSQGRNHSSSKSKDSKHKKGYGLSSDPQSQVENGCEQSSLAPAFHFNLHPIKIGAQRDVLAKRESTHDEDHQTRAHLLNLQAAMMKKESQDDQNQGDLRKHGKTGNTGPEARTRAVRMRLKVLCHSLGSLAAQRAREPESWWMMNRWSFQLVRT